MYKPHRMKKGVVYNEERFRTPLEQERALALWVDRIGWRQSDSSRPLRFRRLGQYAAVAIQTGNGVLEILAQGTYALAKGDVILLSPQATTRYYAEGEWDTRWVVWNGPEASVLERFTGLGPETPLVRGGAAAVLRAWQRLDPLMARQDFEALLSRKLALLDLVRELSVLHRDERGRRPPAYLQAAMEELAAAEGVPEPVQALAQRWHVSPAQFRRQFKAHTGSSPKAFQLAQRVTRAKELLSEGVSIKETAARLGFADVFHFMRLFRRVTGETAGQFVAVAAKRCVGHGCPVTAGRAMAPS